MAILTNIEILKIIDGEFSFEMNVCIPRNDEVVWLYSEIYQCGSMVGSYVDSDGEFLKEMLSEI